MTRCPALGEFGLIERYFRRPVRRAALGGGDDCALLRPRAGYELAVSSDMLVAGRHFFDDVDPFRLGHKALAVNLSDLAACGAQPLAFTLAIALPEAREAWLAPLADGIAALADATDCDWIGGDTTKGPLNLCVTVFGDIPLAEGCSQALLRSGARAGDTVYVSGTLGDARLALEALQGKRELPAQVLRWARDRLEMPPPRGLGRGIAWRCDCGHRSERRIGRRSGPHPGGIGVGAVIDVDAVAARVGIRTVFPEWVQPLLQWREWALSGGDDYELLFTAPPACAASVTQAAAVAQTPVFPIGRIEAEPGVRWVDSDGRAVLHHHDSYDHFA
ncbi:thiamine-monophosphate kinase [Candidatus Symbiobacter mobilis CR]|uniref:Thiamine-monophosphate kinase n=1 Tax=Candidatus Symbiobacter mobilis CR TaxID=946483 RepID=U5N8D6_9BURK|nr:thiamine-monophosphate kinase [Candidatus Symbiobacter mobilis CR]